MAERQMHPGQDAHEIRVHTRVNIFTVLVNSRSDLTPDDAAKQAREIADLFTRDYED